MVKSTGSFLMSIFPNYRRFRAFALITSLVLISLLSILSLNFAHRSRIDFKMAINRSLSKKAAYYAYSGYNMAISLIMKDNNSYDGLSDIWAQQIPAIPIENGVISLSIEDEESKFNIDKVVTSYGLEDKRRETMFIRILQLLKIDTNITYAMVDWEDHDSNTLPLGAEENYYMNLPRPYKPFNSPFITIGEIMLIKGFKRDYYYLPPDKRSIGSEKKYDALRDYITVYGDGLININTASVPVLCSLSRDINETVAEDIVNYRNEHPFEKKEDLKNVETISELLYDEIDSLITVKSNIFRIRVRGIISDVEQRIDAVVMRQNMGVRVVYFSRSI